MSLLQVRDFRSYILRLAVLVCLFPLPVQASTLGLECAVALPDKASPLNTKSGCPLVQIAMTDRVGLALQQRPGADMKWPVGLLSGDKPMPLKTSKEALIGTQKDKRGEFFAVLSQQEAALPVKVPLPQGVVLLATSIMMLFLSARMGFSRQSARLTRFS